MAPNKSENFNFEVDYVISYKFKDSGWYNCTL